MTTLVCCCGHRFDVPGEVRGCYWECQCCVDAREARLKAGKDAFRFREQLKCLKREGAHAWHWPVAGLPADTPDAEVWAKWDRDGGYCFWRREPTGVLFYDTM